MITVTSDLLVPCLNLISVPAFNVRDAGGSWQVFPRIYMSFVVSAAINIVRRIQFVKFERTGMMSGGENMRKCLRTMSLRKSSGFLKIASSSFSNFW